ncbi:MAG: hypothetical protein ABJF67_01150 [Aurantimonas coralicida]|nr:hypothetical protein [Aurantimonas coralicida]MDE0923691.1 hypothetical protein [Aurantimonas coralicida]
MKAFLLSVAIVLLIGLGVGLLLNTELEQSASEAYSTDNVRLQ